MIVLSKIFTYACNQSWKDRFWRARSQSRMRHSTLSFYRMARMRRGSRWQLQKTVQNSSLYVSPSLHCFSRFLQLYDRLRVNRWIKLYSSMVHSWWPVERRSRRRWLIVSGSCQTSSHFKLDWQCLVDQGGLNGFEKAHTWKSKIGHK